MSYSAFAVANAILKTAQSNANLTASISLFKLQQLMFLIHGWTGVINNEPLTNQLIDSFFVRYQENPGLPAIEGKTNFTSKHEVIRSRFIVASPSREIRITPTVVENDYQTWQVIKAVMRRYAHLTCDELNALMCHPDAQWCRVRIGDPLDEEAIRYDVQLTLPSHVSLI